MKTEIMQTIRETFSLKEDQVKESTPLEEIAKDSMDIIELVAVLSDTYKVAIEPSKMNKIKNVGDIVEYVMENKNTKSGNTSANSF